MASLLLPIIYLAFISLGLPDSVLGSAWPSMYVGFNVPVSFAGIISMIIAACTVISSLLSDRITKKFGAGLVTAVSVMMTALSLFGFSLSHSFLPLCFLAVPYGLGAGSVDAALNNYVALHFESRHMNWLHAMWGVGTIIGPNIMAAVLSGSKPWNKGYLYLFIIQIILSAVIFISLPLWKKGEDLGEASKKPISLKEVLSIKGSKEIMVTFFCYSAVEQTAMLWISSYMVLKNGLDTAAAASLSSLFFVGITVGRIISGFITFKLNDTAMIRLGLSVTLFGCILLILPLGTAIGVAGILIIGLGCAPIYPSVIHSTPHHFGADKSQAVIGVQMAAAYIGTTLMPPVFGLIANHISVSLLPLYLLLFTVLMIIFHERLVKKTQNGI